MSDKIFLSCRVSSKRNKAEINSVYWEINQICINEHKFSLLRNQSDMHQWANEGSTLAHNDYY